MPGVTPGLTVSGGVFILETSLSKPIRLRQSDRLFLLHSSAKSYAVSCLRSAKRAFRLALPAQGKQGSKHLSGAHPRVGMGLK
jgi:hypothetical protein